MQIKIYSIPLTGGERLNEEMNTFLRTKRILQVESKQVIEGECAAWTFCIRYLEDNTASPSSFYSKEGQKPDYESLLDKPSYDRFVKMRKIRRDLSKSEGIPAYTIFTDEQMSELAKIETLSVAQMKSVKGIGEKTAEKYCKHFIINLIDETSQPFV
jgi:superfamily II DNA helicase RecQ